MKVQQPDISVLLEMLRIDSPSGDEAEFADWLETWIPKSIPGVALRRIGDNVIAVRGTAPQTALFAHIDTTGFTLGYNDALIPIGSPAAEVGDKLKELGQPHSGAIASVQSSGEWILGGAAGSPGSRYVYSASPVLETKTIQSPYLDNRAGVYSALQCLSQCDSIVVAFTTGEEHSGGGASLCTRVLYNNFGVKRALISDITWDTDDIHCGKGVAISLRDRMVPRRRFLDQVLEIAERSGIPYQREIESAGGSDGGYIQRSGYPIDWVFVGAPEKDPHTAKEQIAMDDLAAMTAMLCALVRELK